MCGICGEMRFDGDPVAAPVVAAMRDALVHRGPDAAGIFVSANAVAGLGFRRLKIVDLSDSANQPLANEDGTIQVVFNGEIYNFAGLREDLLRKGHTFRSRTDSEVIVHLYEEYGSACIDKLDGMFAIGIWDDRQQQLLLARDRAGKKPLYYAQTERRVIFASEVKAFFARQDFEAEVDPAAIPAYLLYGYVPCPNTFYRGVRQLEPGSVITIGRDGHTSSRVFWRLQFPRAETVSPQPFDRSAAVAKVRELVTSAVERRLVSDVPLGAFLSGGVDSTIIVGLMSQLVGRPVKTFSIGFKDSPGYDETSFARLAAARFKTDHTEFVVEPGAFDLIEQLVWQHDGPFADSSAVPTSIVSQLTRQHVTVVLTGDGGDELFAGYMRFYAAQAAERLPRAVRVALAIVGRALPQAGSTGHWLSRAQRFAAAASLPLEERLTRWSGLFYDDVDKMLSPECRELVGPTDRLQYLNRFRSEMDGLSTLSRTLLINFNTYLLDDLLVKVDRCTMAHSLEARSPFLDTALIDYVAGLPDALKLDGRTTKVVLREAFQDLIPREIQGRGKMGFGIPFGHWFRGALREKLDDLLLSSTARYQEYVSADYVHGLVKRHHEGGADLGLQLWTLLTLEIWLQALPRWTTQRSASMPAN